MNINPETGIRYGTIYGNSVPDLVDDIMSNGEDLGYEYARKEIIKQLDIVDNYHFDEQFQELKDVLDDLYLFPSFDDEEISAIVKDINETEFTDDETVGEYIFEQYVCDRWHYESDSDSASYEWVDGEYHYAMSSLGGALLVWVYQSPNVVFVNSLCSPCVPNAGDLDSGFTSANEGYECYGIHPEYPII